MKRASLIPLLAVALACPRDKTVKSAGDSVALDTTPADLSSIQTSLPPAAPDTFKPQPARRAPSRSPSIPLAPEPLMAAVRREQEMSKFCYQEFGQKSDPTLSGGVAVVVTVGTSGVTAARVANDSWTSPAGREVNRCLNDKAATAWKLTPGVVKAGKYVVQLSFRGT